MVFEFAMDFYFSSIAQWNVWKYLDIVDSSNSMSLICVHFCRSRAMVLDFQKGIFFSIALQL